MVPGPEAHRGPPGEGLGGAATRGGGPGPRAGSSAIVSRPHREEPVLCMEKGRVSVDEMERSMLDMSPTDSAHGTLSSQVPPCAHSCPHPALWLCCYWGWGCRQAVPLRGVPRAPNRPGHTGAGPHYLALGCSQSLTIEAAWEQKEEGGQRVGGTGRWTDKQQGWVGCEDGSGSGVGAWLSCQPLPVLGSPVTTAAQHNSGHK